MKRSLSLSNDALPVKRARIVRDPAPAPAPPLQPFETLVKDTWNIIASFLPTRDRVAFRLVCKAGTTRDAEFKVNLPPLLRLLHRNSESRVLRRAVQAYMEQGLDEIADLPQRVADFTVREFQTDGGMVTIGLHFEPDTSFQFKEGYAGRLGAADETWILRLYYMGRGTEGPGVRHSWCLFDGRLIFLAARPSPSIIRALLERVVKRWCDTQQSVAECYAQLLKEMTPGGGAAIWQPPQADHPVYAWREQRALVKAARAKKREAWSNLFSDREATRKAMALKRAQLEASMDARPDDLLARYTASVTQNPELDALHRQLVERGHMHADTVDEHSAAIAFIDARIEALEAIEVAHVAACHADWKQRRTHDDIYALLRSKQRERDYYPLVYKCGLHTVDDVVAAITPNVSDEEKEHMSMALTRLDRNDMQVIADILCRLEPDVYKEVGPIHVNWATLGHTALAAIKLVIDNARLL
jgi:hypothetical protein